MAIALFYAVGTGVGGLVAPALFGALIDRAPSAQSVFAGYALGAALMLGGAAVAWCLGVDAERRSLEEIALPIGVPVGTPIALHGAMRVIAALLSTRLVPTSTACAADTTSDGRLAERPMIGGATTFAVA